MDIIAYGYRFCSKLILDSSLNNPNECVFTDYIISNHAKVKNSINNKSLKLLLKYNIYK